MKCKKAFSLIEAVLCVTLLGILLSLSGRIFVTSMLSVRANGNPLYSSKAMRALSIMDAWNENAISAKAVLDLEGFSPAQYASLPTLEMGARALVFKFVRKDAGGAAASYKALEVSGRSLLVRQWDSEGGHMQTAPASMAFPGNGPDIYRAEYSLEHCFGVPVLNMKLFVSRKAGGEFRLEFKTGAEGE